MDDILGIRELESVQINWHPIFPGFSDGRCAATGTCDLNPKPSGKGMEIKKKEKIIGSFDELKAEKIACKYGRLVH